MTAPIISDPVWDWIPYVEGSEIAEGDHVLWAVMYRLTVDEIAQEDNGNGGTMYTFSNTADSLAVQVHYPSDAAPVALTGYQDSQYIVTPHPPVGTTYRNLGDESGWVFQASKTYRCWQAGAVYPVGTVLTKPYIVGALVAL